MLDPAIEIVTSVIQGEQPKQMSMNENVEKQKSTDILNDTPHFCEVSLD